MIDIDEMIDAFRRGRFDLDCTKMVLRQRKDGGRNFEGCGYVRQIDDGSLVFKLYVQRRDNVGPAGSLQILTSGTAGTVFGDDELYDLTATSVDWTSWKAVRIAELYPNWNMQDGTGILSGRLNSIVAGPMLPPMARPFLRLHFFEEYELPLPAWSPATDRPLQRIARDHIKLHACGANFEVTSRLGSGDTVVTATADRKFPAIFHLRIQESLQYITGRSANWRARVENSDGMSTLELASPRPKAAHTQFNPPISPATIEFHSHTWALFERFLSYVVKNTDTTSGTQHWNSVAYHLYMARESTSASIDAWAVGVSVAVEAVASLIVEKLPVDQEKEKCWANLWSHARQWLEGKENLSDGIRDRARGHLSPKFMRPKDALIALAERNLADHECVDAWNKLRNRHVHPNLADLRVPDAAEYRALFKLLQQAGMLLHQLTFHLIGYEGPFTDYSRVGPGSRQYPLVESEEVMDAGSQL